MNILIVCNSIIGKGTTSGSSIRASRFGHFLEEKGHHVCTCRPLLRTRVHPAVNFAVNALFALRFLPRRFDLMYSVSDLAPDALFAVAYRLLWGRSPLLVCGCHSLVQTMVKQEYQARSRLHYLYSCYSQKIILWMLKHIKVKMLVSNDFDNFVLRKRGFKNVVTVYGGANF